MQLNIEPKERMILEIIASVILVAFLILISIIVVNASNGSEVTIKDSYNTYNINVNQLPTYTSSKPYIIDRTYSEKPYIIDDDKRYLRYDSWARNREAEGLFGNSIDNYEVYVQNQDYAGGYFKIIYHFEDYYGNDDSKSMTHYIGPRKEKRFVFKDISPSRYKYRNWWYEVKPITKVSAGDDDYRYAKVYSPHPNKIYFYD